MDQIGFLKRIHFARIILFRVSNFLFGLSLLTACSKSQVYVQETALLQTSAPITATVSPGNSSKTPTKNSSPLATNRVQTNTPYRGSIETATGTVTQTSAPPIIPTHYDLPEWFSNQQHYLFLMISGVTSNSNQISIVDADLSTQFDIPIPYPDIYGYFWTAQEGFLGFLASDLQTAYLVNPITGNVTIHALHAKDTNCLKEDARARDERYNLIFAVNLGIPSGPSPEDEAFLCSEQMDTSQKDLITEVEGSNILVTFKSGRLAGQSTTIQIVSPGDELNVSGDYPFYDPATGKAILVVLKADLPIEPDDRQAYLRLGVPASRIEIYEIISKRKIASYDGVIDPDSILISPDFRQIIFNAEFTEGGKIPCFIDLGTGGLKCLDKLKAQERFEETSLFRLSRDGHRLFLAEKLNTRSDLCIFEIIDKSFNCPTENMKELDGLNIEWYRISADERFFLFQYGSSCPYCDFWGDPSSAVIRMDGENLFLLGREMQLPGSPSFPFYTILARP